MNGKCLIIKGRPGQTCSVILTLVANLHHRHPRLRTNTLHHIFGMGGGSRNVTNFMTHSNFGMATELVTNWGSAVRGSINPVTRPHSQIRDPNWRPNVEGQLKFWPSKLEDQKWTLQNWWNRDRQLIFVCKIGGTFHVSPLHPPTHTHTQPVHFASKPKAFS
jgi:hypothetical protein